MGVAEGLCLGWEGGPRVLLPNSRFGPFKTGVLEFTGFVCGDWQSQFCPWPYNYWYFSFESFISK